MNYKDVKLGEQYLFRKKNHAYDCCMVEVDEFSDPLHHFCSVHIVGTDAVRIWANFDELIKLSNREDETIEKGDIISYENRLFLRYDVRRCNSYFPMYNAIDERGIGYQIDMKKCKKITNSKDRKKFFMDLREKANSTYNKIMETQHESIIRHVDEILRLMNYEVD